MFTVVYDGNGNTGGTASVDPNSPYSGSTLVGILGPGNLTKSGFQFGGWNTIADGSGTQFSPAQAFVINADTTLYAQWIAPQCFISGGLDPSFNGNGIVTTSFESGYAYARSVALQANGQLVTAGAACVELAGNCGFSDSRTSFALARYKTDGNLDSSFGGVGKVVTAINDIDIAYSIAIQQDGRIIAAGSTYGGTMGGFALVRYNSDGSLDRSFGIGGKVVTSLGAAYSVAIQPDGRIVAAGISWNDSPTNNEEFALARYNIDGSLDTSFGTDGIVRTQIRSKNSNAYAVFIQPDGRIIAVGQGIGSLTGFAKQFAVIRFNHDGTLDTSFGTGGSVTTAIGTRSDEAFSVAVQSDGRIVAGGYSDYGPFNNYNFALVRYNANGTLDTSFGSEGKVVTEIGANDFIFSVAMQPDSQIVAAGYAGSAVAVARYNPDGSLDTAVNGTGKIVTPIGSGANTTSMAIQRDGRIAAAGYGITGSRVDFALVRYGEDCSLFTPTPTNSATNTPTPTPTCSAADIILDGGFETGITDPIWNNPNFSSNWGTPLCDIASCGTGGGSASPRTGLTWAWFGSRDRPETARLGQSVIIPPGTAELHFWMRVGNVTAPFSDVLSVKIDNVTVQSYAEPFVSEPQYTERVIDLSAFANGASHNIKFEYRGPTSGEASFLVDDVSLISVSGCATPSPTNTPTQMPTPPTVSVSVGANLAGLAFTVDSVRFTSPQNFIWGSGSVHTISTSALQHSTNTRYLWETWSDGGELSHSVTATADASYTANFKTQHLLDIFSPLFGFHDEGKTIQIEAPVPSGCIFGNWVGTGNGSYSGTANPAIIIMNGPITERTNYICGTTPTATNTPTATPTAPPSGRTAFDYDGDHKADISVFRPTDGAWYLQQSQAGLYGTLLGFDSDKIAPADYDGDGKTDIAVYRPSTGIWYVLKSTDGTVEYYVFGLAEDLPTPADYDGDGKADLSVFRPSSGTWYRQNSSDGSYTGIQFGATEDKPTIGDWDGDGKSDIAVFRPSTGAWYRINSGDGSIYGELFGFGTDIIAPADYDGDGKTDLAAYRPTDGIWYLKYSSNSTYDYKVFGLANDIPAPGDFDGDGKADISVFRPSDGTWYRQNSSDGAFIAFQFGANGDKPTMTAFRY